MGRLLDMTCQGFLLRIVKPFGRLKNLPFHGMRYDISQFEHVNFSEPTSKLPRYSWGIDIS